MPSPARASSALYAGLTILSHRPMAPTPSGVRPIRKAGRVPCSNVLVVLCLGAATRATPMTASSSLAPPCPQHPCLDEEDQLQNRSQHRPPAGTSEGLDFGGDEGRLKVAPFFGSDLPSPSVLQRDSRLFRGKSTDFGSKILMQQHPHCSRNTREMQSVVYRSNSRPSGLSVV